MKDVMNQGKETERANDALGRGGIVQSGVLCFLDLDDGVDGEGGILTGNVGGRGRRWRRRRGGHRQFGLKLQVRSTRYPCKNISALVCISLTLSIFYKSRREKKTRVALHFYLKVMAPWWLLYFFKYVFDMTFSYPKPSFPRVTLLSQT